MFTRILTFIILILSVSLTGLSREVYAENAAAIQQTGTEHNSDSALYLSTEPEAQRAIHSPKRLVPVQFSTADEYSAEGEIPGSVKHSSQVRTSIRQTTKTDVRNRINKLIFPFHFHF